MISELADEDELLYVRVRRSGDGGVVGSVSRPGGPQWDFTGWLGLLALLQRAMRHGDPAETNE